MFFIIIFIHAAVYRSCAQALAFFFPMVPSLTTHLHFTTHACHHQQHQFAASLTTSVVIPHHLASAAHLFRLLAVLQFHLLLLLQWTIIFS
jgi:hypothetical protein